MEEILVDDCVSVAKYYRNSYAEGDLKAVMLFYPTKSVFSNGDEKTEMVFWPLRDVEKHDLKPGDVFEFHNKTYRKSIQGRVQLRYDVEIRKNGYNP